METVKTGEVIVKYSIRKDDGNVPAYDWKTDGEVESNEWFESIEEAEADARWSLGA